MLVHGLAYWIKKNSKQAPLQLNNKQNDRSDDMS